jgi:hypothetical protein
MMRVAVAAMLLVFLGPSVFALAEDGRRVPASASTPESASAAPASTSAANGASAATSVSPNALVAALPDAPPAPAARPSSATASEAKAAETGISEAGVIEAGVIEAGVIEAGVLEVKPAEPLSDGTLSMTPAAAEPSLGNGFLASNSLAPIHALLVPPAAFIKLKTPPRTHSFFDARNRLGLATLGASLTADALSTQKGLAYPGFVEMNPIARPFVQSRMGAAAYNAGSFGLMAGLMYWAHKTEHHKLERILPFAIGGWEGLLSVRNYRVIANRPR